jgi:CHAT domain-containing protein/tetratricopeptide (TPR) repeat protein
VDVVLEPLQSGVQLFVIRGETKEAIDRRPFSAAERIAFADTERVELELVAPAVAWPRSNFTLEVISSANAKGLAAIDATSMQAIASTIPATAEGLMMAATQLTALANEARALGDAARAGALTLTAAEFLLRIGDPQATARFNEALESQVPETVGSAHLGLAAIEHEKGRLEAAIAHQQQARAVAGDDELLHARIDVAEADDLAERGDHAQCVGKLVPRLDLVRKNGHPHLIAEFESSIGWCHKELGDRKKATDHFERGHKAALITQDGRAIGHALHDLGGMRSSFDSDWKGALPFYLEAVKVRRVAGDKQGLAFSLDAAGEMESTLLDPIALERHAEALLLRRELGSVRGEAQTLTSWGSAYGRLNRPAEAMEPLRRAVHLFVQLGDVTWEAYAYYRLGRAELMAKHYPEAVAWAEKALALSESLRERIASEDRRAYYSAGVRKYYDLWVAAAALQSQVKGERVWFEKALEASERARARALLDFLTLVEADRPVGQQALLTEEDTLRARIRELENEARRFRATSSADAGAPPQEAQLELELAAYEKLRAQVQAADPKVASLSTLPLATLADVEAMVGADSLVVEYSLGRNGAYALVLGGKAPAAFVLADQKELNEAAETIHKQYSARNEDVAGETAAARVARIDAADVQAEATRVKLREALIAPFEALLAGKRRLIVVADGALHLVPWAALVPELAVQSTPSLSVLKAQRATKRAAPTSELVAVGDPVFEADDPRLGGKPVVPAPNQLRAGEKEHYQRLLSSRAEVESVGALVAATKRSVLLDFDASKARLNAAGRPRIVHIATHGVLDTEHPERSGLVLSRRAPDGTTVDGFLSLAEVYALSLPADLVTLSACETALGAEVRGEGFIGLARGFLHAGARAVVASLWKVHDRATAELMKAFYVGVLQLGLPNDKALARAQKVLASQERFKSPYYWAGFVLYGG